MQIIRDYNSVADGRRGAVVALGNFDGVHCGHRKVIEEAGRLAAETGVPHGVLTFEPHPRKFFNPDEAAFELTPLGSRTRQLENLGVDLVYLIGFDAEFAAKSAETFFSEILVEGLGVRHVVTGYDFVFGHGRKGDVELLRTLGAANGIGVTVIGAVTGPDGETCSSTTIRNHITGARPECAARLLGRCWEIEGVVQTGDRRGRQIGFPTANVDPGDYVQPALGVYAVWAGLETADGTVWREAVANIGRRPTFDGEKVMVEVYIFDFEDDIYDRVLRVALVGHLRPEKKFDGLPEIREQIAKDCSRAREILAASGGVGVTN